MGPSDEDGQLVQQQIASQLATIGAPPARNADAATKKAYMEKLTAAVQETINAEAKQARDKATQALTDKAKEVEKAVTSTKQAMESAAHQPSFSADQQREKAISTFNDSINKIKTLMTQIDNRDTLHKTISDKINTAYNELNPDNTDSNDKIDKLHTLRRNVNEQKQNLRGRAAEYYAIIPYLLGAPHQERHRTRCSGSDLEEGLHRSVSIPVPCHHRPTHHRGYKPD